MAIVALATSLGVQLLRTAIARTVVVVETMNVPLYRVDLVVGVLPSMV
jgi:hypothetical protein